MKLNLMMFYLMNRFFKTMRVRMRSLKRILSLANLITIIVTKIISINLEPKKAHKTKDLKHLITSTRGKELDNLINWILLIKEVPLEDWDLSRDMTLVIRI